MTEATPFPLSARVGRIKPSPTIAVSTKATELRAAGRDILNLGAGEPDFDTPDHIKAAAANAAEKGQTKYTAVNGTPRLRQAVAEKFRRENDLDYPPENIVVSNGAKQSVMNAMLALLDAGDQVLICAPYWVSYPDMALLADATPVFVSADADAGYKISPAQLAAALTEKTRMVILNAPSNPSGALFSREELRGLGEALRPFPRAMIVSDDIYEHIRYDGREFCNIANACPDLAARTIVVNGVSKAYAMTGWRIGYAAARAELAKAMTKIQSQTTSNASSVSQAAAVAALESGTDCVAPMLAAYARRRETVSAALNGIPGVKCPPIEGAFYAFADAREGIARLAETGALSAADDVVLCAELLEKTGVAAVPGGAFGSPGHFRISFAASDETLKVALERLGNFFAG